MAKLTSCLLWFLTAILYCSLEARKPSAGDKVVSVLASRMITRFEFLENCENVSNLSVRLSNIQIGYAGTTSSVSLNADVQNDRVVNRISKAILTARNCEDKSKGTCQHFSTWRFKDNVCELLQLKHEFWSPIFQNIHPLWKCPTPAGKYLLRNGSLDTELLAALPFPHEKYFWRVRIEAFDFERFFCIDAGIQSFRVVPRPH